MILGAVAPPSKRSRAPCHSVLQQREGLPRWARPDSIEDARLPFQRVTEPLASLLPQCPVAMPGSTGDRQLQTPQPPRHPQASAAHRPLRQRAHCPVEIDRVGRNRIDLSTRAGCLFMGSLVFPQVVRVLRGDVGQSSRVVGGRRGWSSPGRLAVKAGSGGGSVNEGCRSQRWLHP